MSQAAPATGTAAGGALPGSVTFSMSSGTANAAYILLVSLREQSTPIPSLGITLDLAPDFVDFSLTVPGMTGLLNGAGAASVTLPLPNDLGLAGIPFALQAVGQSGPVFSTSNLVRQTLQGAGTFASPLNQPPVPIIGGAVFNEPAGELLFVGGSGPAALRYQSRLETWQLGGASFGAGLFSQTTALADGRIPHGLCVARGLHFALDVSESLSAMRSEDAERCRKVLLR
jgi:hypothetical protein